MSFRGRLTAFFVTIVVVPMVAVAVLVIEVTEDSREGKSDARLATALETAQTTYDRALEDASAEVARIADTVPGIERALSAPNRGYLGRVARQQAAADDIARVAFYDSEGERLAAAGSPDAIASSRRPVQSAGATVGEIEVAGLDAGFYARELARLTGTEAVVVADRGELAATVRTGAAELPDGAGGETVELAAGEMRAAALSLDGAPAGTRLVLATDAEEGFVASEPLIAVVLLAFFALALALIGLLLRMLQRQIATMLTAAERIGGGDFSGRVPAEGNDEMAGLAAEFNKMSDRLSRQMQQLRKQREELDRSVQRIGEAFAAGLDRSALLEIVLDTALGACEAETGRIQLRDHIEPEAIAGVEPTGALAEALVAASRQALQRSEPVEVEAGAARGIAQPLSRAGDPGSVVGTMAVARAGEAFTPAEREVLRYLAGQAAVSVENIGLHERVAEQAVTDELTGLANNRHFRDWIGRETERLSRFGGELSLVLLDIDNFKEVNDTYGHLQGDRVLESVGRVLQLESRGVDEAARYGGEEFVLALPETPKQGAVEVAERIRERITGTEVPGVDGNDPVAVTASLGVATMPGDGLDPQGLVAAADAALYEAKRSGKDRVVAANEG